MSFFVFANNSGPLLTPWVVMPIAGVLLIVIGAHLNALAAAPMPASRRRIRVVNGWLMLLTTPLAAYAFAMATPSNTRLYVLVWLAVVGLIGIIVMLAVMDMLNTQRLYRTVQRELTREIKGLHREVAATVQTKSPTGSQDGRVPREGTDDRSQS